MFNNKKIVSILLIGYAMMAITGIVLIIWISKNDKSLFRFYWLPIILCIVNVEFHYKLLKIDPLYLKRMDIPCIYGLFICQMGLWLCKQLSLYKGITIAFYVFWLLLIALNFINASYRAIYKNIRWNLIDYLFKQDK